MATVYSLICFGGLAGKTVTFTDAGDVVNLTSHGLRNGKGVFFSDNGNTLPTGLAKDTLYYARQGADANKFTLHTTAADAIAGTGQVTFSGTGSGTHKVKSSLLFGPVDLSRWGSSGSERIYDGKVAYVAARASASGYDEEVCEIGEEWDDIYVSNFSIGTPAATTTFTTLVNGVRSSGYHNGGVLTGYVFKYGGYGTITGYNTTFDGYTIKGTNTSATMITSSYATGSTLKKMVLYGPGSGTASIGCLIAASNTRIDSCTIMNFGTGIRHNQYWAGNVVSNNTIVKNGTGVVAATVSGIYCSFYNNAVAGNTTDWGAQPTGLITATNNSGTGAWVTSGGTTLTIATTDFLDYANNDFRPALSTSPQVEAGVRYYDDLTTDILDHVRPDYMNGAAAYPDVGAFEYDHGYGPWPNTVTVAGSGIVDGTRIKIAKQSDGTEYRNVVLSGATTDSYTQDAPSNIPVFVYASKGSAAPFYKPLKLSATITAASGLTYNLSGLQIEDIARGASYPAGVATDWSFNTGTGAITHTTGSTIYTVQDLYSYYRDWSDDATTIDDALIMDGTTPNVFSLIGSGAISDADHQYLKGGSISEAGGNTLWSNLYTVGTLTGTPALYVVQGTSKLTAFWSAGHIDVLVKVKASGILISSGLVTTYSRKWGYTYDHYQTDLSSGGRNVAPIATAVDAEITETTTTVGGWTDVTYTFGTLSRDFGDGGGAQTYYVEVDCNNRPLSEVHQRCQYVTREDSTTTMNSVEGWRYQAAHSSMTPVKSAPFGTYAGGFFTAAPGVWLKNVPTADQYNYQLTDAAGGTHQNVQSLFQTVTISGVVAGSRIQVYDTTNNSELYNGTPTFPYTWTDSGAPTGNRAIRLRVTYVSGTTAKTMIEASIGTCGTSAETKDVSYLASQSNDAVYIANAIDGSLVTNVTIDDTTNEVRLNLSSGSVTWPQIYAYQVHWLNTATGIQDDFSFMEAVDSSNYLLTGFKLKNITSPTVPCTVTGGYGRDATTGTIIDIIDTTGGMIFPLVDHVVNNIVTVGGSNIITGDIADVAAQVQSGLTTQGYTSARAAKLDNADAAISGVPAAMLTAAQATPMYAHIRQINGVTLAGGGTSADPMRPA